MSSTLVSKDKSLCKTVQQDSCHTAFKEEKDQEKEAQLNVAMMRRVVRAVKALSRNFKFFVYPGGTRVCLSLASNFSSDMSIPGIWYLPSGRHVHRASR